MRIVVTGAAGFIGRPLLGRLAASGHDVIGIDLVGGARIVTADIRDLPCDVFEGADAVVHLAGVSFAPEWDDADALVWDVNVSGMQRVVAQCEAAGVRRFVLASSASVYEGHDDVPATIATPAAPVSAYARSKVACERILEASTIPQRIVVRKGTVCGFGPQPRLDLLTNAMSLAALRSRTVFVDGPGANHRPLVRLERAIAVYAFGATYEQAAGLHAVNVCDDNVTVVDVARRICELTGARLEHRVPRGRLRSYRVLAGSSAALDLPDLPEVDAGTIVEHVVREARIRLDQLPSASSDPRIDRLATIQSSLPPVAISPR